jgi:hypothetical protein
MAEPTLAITENPFFNPANKTANSTVVTVQDDQPRNNSVALDLDQAEDEYAPTLSSAAPNPNSARRSLCQSCSDWWASSAGGTSGVLSIVFVSVLAFYAALTAAMSTFIDAITNFEPGTSTAEDFVQVGRGGGGGNSYEDCRRLIQ